MAGLSDRFNGITVSFLHARAWSRAVRERVRSGRRDRESNPEGLAPRHASNVVPSASRLASPVPRSGPVLPSRGVVSHRSTGFGSDDLRRVGGSNAYGPSLTPTGFESVADAVSRLDPPGPVGRQPDRVVLPRRPDGGPWCPVRPPGQRSSRPRPSGSWSSRAEGEGLEPPRAYAPARFQGGGLQTNSAWPSRVRPLRRVTCRYTAGYPSPTV